MSDQYRLEADVETCRELLDKAIERAGNLRAQLQAVTSERDTLKQTLRVFMTDTEIQATLSTVSKE